MKGSRVSYASRLMESWRGIKERLSTPMLFLIITLIIATATAAINIDVARDALTIVLHTLQKIWLVIVIVFALLFFFNLFISPRHVKRWLGDASGLKGWLLAILGGIISSGPIYLWYPLLADLREHGMRDGLVATFLYNRAVKLPLLPLLIGYFGVTYAVLLTAVMIPCSVVEGVLIEKFMKKKERS